VTSSFRVQWGHRRAGPTALLQCNIAYMRRSVSSVKEFLLHCIINNCFTFDGEIPSRTSLDSNGVTFPKHRYFKLDFRFALRLGTQFGLIAPSQG
jgi:hypothetical protein